MNDDKIFEYAADQLAELMDKLNLTQSELADKANLTQGQINHIINKRRIGTILTWFKISKALNVPIDFFFKR